MRQNSTFWAYFTAVISHIVLYIAFINYILRHSRDKFLFDFFACGKRLPAGQAESDIIIVHRVESYRREL